MDIGCAAMSPSGPTAHALKKFQDTAESFAIWLLIQLSIFDHLPDHDEAPVDIGKLSQQASVEVTILKPLLRVLVASGLLRYDADLQAYKNTLSSVAYRTGNPSADFLNMMHVEGFATLAYLPAWLRRRGRTDPLSRGGSHTHNAYTFRAGLEGERFFDIISKDETRLQRFQAGLQTMNFLHPFTGFYDWKRLISGRDNDESRLVLVDVGGGNGHSLALILKENIWLSPELTVLQDTDACIRLAAKNVDLPTGVQLMPHDFFGPQPVKGARAYYIRACLHDYSDNLCVAILRNIVSAMTCDSKLIIAETVLEDVPARGELVSSVEMIMLAVGGRERSLPEFEHLIQESGLQIVGIFHSAVKSWAIIETTLRQHS